ncbi:MAG: hypothetical protein H7X91_03285 [Burkholderiales bacterium]|nr:hypothetical protein [Burkholderiales bacterium]
MGLFDKLNGDADPNGRYTRAIRPGASPITLEHQGKIYRGNFTVVGSRLIVSCGEVITEIEMDHRHPEPQAREAMRELVRSGKLGAHET